MPLPSSTSSASSSTFDLSDELDIDVTSACSRNWKSEYRQQYKDHRSANTGGRRAAHWSRVADKRTATLVEREREVRSKRGQPLPTGYPAYAIKWTHREGGASKQAEEAAAPLASVLSEMKTRSDLFVPISAIQRPVRVAPPSPQQPSENAQSPPQGKAH